MSDDATRDACPVTGANVGRGFSFQEPLLFERSREGRVGYSLPDLDVPAVDPAAVLGQKLVRSAPASSGPGAELDLPELSEIDVIRHFTRISTWNAAIDLGIYPLGSCTMKHNPRINEKLARLPGFACGHPLQPAALAQGFLELVWRLERQLAEISGMDIVSLQPAAGAQGELAGIMMIRAYHERAGERRSQILIPDTAHGTNPASAALNDYQVVTIPSGEDGILHPEDVAERMTPDVAGIMLTNPNTLGLFERHVAEITKIVHDRGGLVYGDGANLNATLGVAKPGDLGIDVMHFNLHKTFSTPHGGGGPGAGPIGVKKLLAPHLPIPVVVQSDAESGTPHYRLDCELPHSIGRLHRGFGNSAMFVRAYSYIRSLGPEGLRRCAEMAVLNANYLLSRLKNDPAGGPDNGFHVPYPGGVMHECVLSDRNLHDTGVTTLDISKRLIDHGYHPPTIYFPLIVAGAIMIEPTESESLEELDRFADALLEIEREAREHPERIKSAPHSTRHSRLNETQAARRPILRWHDPRRAGDGSETR